MDSLLLILCSVLLSFTLITYFDVQIVPGLTSGSSYSSALCLFDMSPSFFKYFLAFWFNGMFKVHLVLSQNRPWNQPFSLWSSSSIWGKVHLETKIYASGVLTRIGGHTLSISLYQTSWVYIFLEVLSWTLEWRVSLELQLLSPCKPGATGSHLTTEKVPLGNKVRQKWVDLRGRET